MKIKAILILLLWATFASAGGPDGFRDLKWGDPPKSVMTLMDKRGDFAFYQRDGDNCLTKDPCEIVTYTFCKDKFCEIFGRVRGEDAFRELSNLVIAYYGEPTYYDPDNWFWLNDTDIFLTYFESEGVGYFMYHHNPLFIDLLIEKLEKMKLEKKERSQKVRDWLKERIQQKRRK